MSGRIDVYFLPELAPADRLRGAQVAMIDVLRASTVMVEALGQGAAGVVACEEIDEARAAAAALPPGGALLGGERGGLPIAGFDLGNSPAEYAAHRVRGRTLIITTTNGTRALARANQASERIIASLTNAEAAARWLAPRERVVLLCAGTRGEITREDVLCAGLLTAHLTSATSTGPAAPRRELNDQAELALAAWNDLAARAQAAGRVTHQGKPTPEWLRDELASTQGGRNVAALGLARDLADVALLDRWNLVPVWDHRSGRIVAAAGAGP